MKRHIATCLAALSLSFIASSCIVDTGSLELMLGNISFSRGDWQDATVHYLRAQKAAGVDQAWVSYNLANVYHSLGELDAALRLWDSASLTKNNGLRFNVFFNRGIALYEAGRFNEAYTNFRDALVLDPSNIDAKRNLELAQKKVQIAVVPVAPPSGPASPLTGTTTTTVSAATGLSEGSARVLEYIRRKEGQVWVPGTAPPSSSVGEDW